MSMLVVPSRASDAGPEESASFDTADMLFEAEWETKRAMQFECRRKRIDAIEAAIEWLQQALKRDRDGLPYIER